jgi:hypothetical protein
MLARPITIVETREFERQAAAIFAVDELDALKAHLAFAPTAGVSFPVRAAFASCAGAPPARASGVERG